MGEVAKQFPKKEFLEALASGLMEPEALSKINENIPAYRHFQMATYVLIQAKDIDFREAVEAAKKQRADNWFGDIARSVSQTLDKEDVPAAKLKFEQRKYLAAIDNPDKYAEKSKASLEVTMNIFQQMKDLSTIEARQILASADPFMQIDAESKPLPSAGAPIEEAEEEFDHDIFK